MRDFYEIWVWAAAAPESDMRGRVAVADEQPLRRWLPADPEGSTRFADLGERLGSSLLNYLPVGESWLTAEEVLNAPARRAMGVS